VFSPYYAWAHERGLRSGRAADPGDYCAINVALYSPGRKRWTMTERGRRSTERSATHFRVGPSALDWRGDELVITIDERSAPIPLKVRGTVRLRAERWFDWQMALEPSGRHRWGPLAPAGRIAVDFDQPGIRWSGHGYVDSNEGDEPLADRFEEWDWSRGTLVDGSSAVVYDVRTRSGSEHLIAQRFGADGSVSEFDPGPRWKLSPTARCARTRRPRRHAFCVRSRTRRSMFVRLLSLACAAKPSSRSTRPSTGRDFAHRWSG
jgi:carotenoid 1,2-hydratase